MSLVMPNRQDDNKSIVITGGPKYIPTPLCLIWRAKTDASSKKIRIYVWEFLLSIEEPSVYYSNEKQPMFACFCLATGLNKFFHKSAQMGISCINCVLEEFWKTNSQNSQPNQFLRYLKYLLQIKLIAKYSIWVFYILISVAMETVNRKIWCSSCFQKINIQLECYIF